MTLRSRLTASTLRSSVLSPSGHTDSLISTHQSVTRAHGVRHAHPPHDTSHKISCPSAGRIRVSAASVPSAARLGRPPSLIQPPLLQPPWFPCSSSISFLHQLQTRHRLHRRSHLLPAAASTVGRLTSLRCPLAGTTCSLNASSAASTALPPPSSPLPSPSPLHPQTTPPSPPPHVCTHVYMPAGRFPSLSLSNSSWPAMSSRSIVMLRFSCSGCRDASTAARKTADLMCPPVSSKRLP